MIRWKLNFLHSTRIVLESQGLSPLDQQHWLVKKSQVLYQWMQSNEIRLLPDKKGQVWYQHSANYPNQSTYIYNTVQ